MYADTKAPSVHYTQPLITSLRTADFGGFLLRIDSDVHSHLERMAYFLFHSTFDNGMAEKYFYSRCLYLLWERKENNEQELASSVISLEYVCFIFNGRTRKTGSWSFTSF